ncbi:hypothetical protein NUW58_g1330 [Xylaria curta]|uniref:Uncharacterized protein n=1 Tax=Xylaria curta TaxID=42375 RepID=A0ACC1PLV9_9PEZI|nr:hypothetical protein NUW58_g1330 [Xylaria curta]
MAISSSHFKTADDNSDSSSSLSDFLPSQAPDRQRVHIVRAKRGDELRIGELTCRVMEDGTRTENRFGALEFTIPPGTTMSDLHYHGMHDETFLVMQGSIKVRAGGKTTEAKAGDYIVMPAREPHAISNASDADAVVFNTFTPAHYINYFKMLANMQRHRPKEMLNEREIEHAMARYATMYGVGPAK